MTTTEKSEATAIFRDAEQTFAGCNSDFARRARTKDAELRYMVLQKNGVDQRTLLVLSDTFCVKIQADTKQIRLVTCRGGRTMDLMELLKKPEFRQEKPHLSDSEVLASARRYLDTFHIPLLPETQVKITYNEIWPFCWDIRWHRCIQGYPWDDSDSSRDENVVVTFHEQFGLMIAANTVFSPAPKSLKVSVTREEAIGKAMANVPKVMGTPYYRELRADGFVADKVESCELKVAIPNWLLDPQRAEWLPEKFPEETRLCWVVWVSTVDTKAADRPKAKNGTVVKLICPKILLYIDAATGEIVGANF
jgi:hypothetical protein